MKIGEKELKKYLFWAVIVILIILSYFIIKPFIIALISAFILAYLTRPIYNKLNKKFSDNLKAFICVFLIALIILVPAGLMIKEIISQGGSFVNEGNIKNILTTISEFKIIKSMNLDLTQITNQGISFLIGLFTSMIMYAPSMILSILISLIGMFFILKKWDMISSELKQYLPFKDKKATSKELMQVTNNILYGVLIIAIIEFILALVGFYLIGVKFYMLSAILIFFMAFIPGLGPAIVWIPMTIYYLFMQDYTTAIPMIIFGVFLSSFIDTILRAKIISDKTKVNPLIMIIGILGGLSVFGIFGFIIGPLVLVYTLKLIQGIIKN